MTALSGDSERVLVVRIGDARRALPIDRLQGAATPSQVLRLPSPPPGLCGAVPFHGQVVPVVDAGTLLGRATDGSGPLLFLQRSSEVIALRVDAILGVRAAADTERLDLDALPVAPAPLQPRSAAAPIYRAERHQAPQLPGLLFRIGGRPFWLGADQALEVLPQAEPASVPWADPLLPALLLHGGEPIAVARLDMLLGTSVIPNGPWVVCRTGPERLAFRIDDVPTLAERGDAPLLDLHEVLRGLPDAGAPARPRPPPPWPAAHPYVAFQLERQLCLLPLRQVRSVSEQGRVIKLPGASAALQGARAVGGRMLPVLDPRPLLGLEAAMRPSVHLEVASADAPAFVLAVQGVDSVVHIPADAIAAATGGAIQGVLKLHGRRAWLLDGAGLLRAVRAAP